MENIRNQENIENRNHIFCIIRKIKHKNGEIYTSEEKQNRIALLLNDGADINAQDKNNDNNSLLHVAALKRDEALIKWLIRAGINPNITNAKGQNPKDILDTAELSHLLPCDANNTPKQGTITKKRKLEEININSDDAENTGQGAIKYPIPNKKEIYDFMTSLVGCEPHSAVFVNIEMSDNDSNDNVVQIVGRPPVLGSSRIQMRHVIPYSFLKAAIVSQIKENIVSNFTKLIFPALLPMKAGICISEVDFNKYIIPRTKNIFSKKTAKDLYEIKLKTTTSDNQENLWYLIDNNKVLKIFKTECGLSDDQIQEAQNKYNTKWLKYLNFGIKCLNDKIHDNELAQIDSAKLMARLILTVFNRSETACFADEGNTLTEEIKWYASSKDAIECTDNYVSYSHNGICKKYNEIPKDSDNVVIRIVRNEGPIVIRASKALSIINSILYESKKEIEDKELQKYITEYNDKYNFYITIELNTEDKAQYNDALSYTNYNTNYKFHVAKHLYSVFDFKALEKYVLTPDSSVTRDPKKDQIEVFPSAEDTTSALYSIHDGGQYREECYNKRKTENYNKKALFRNLLTAEDTQEILMEKLVSHFFISLIPFEDIILPKEEDGSASTNLIKETFDAFYRLAQKDYQGSDIILDNFLNVQENTSKAAILKFNKIIANIYQENLNVSYGSSEPQSAVTATGATIEIPEYIP